MTVTDQLAIVLLLTSAVSALSLAIILACMGIALLIDAKKGPAK